MEPGSLDSISPFFFAQEPTSSLRQASCCSLLLLPLEQLVDSCWHGVAASFSSAGLERYERERAIVIEMLTHHHGSGP